jgi:ABC-type transport system involved in multi-copper enzyme maturation permease subunit
VRLKVFYFLLIFALAIIGSSAFVVKFSFQEQFQVLKDVSLGAMSIFTWLLGVLATAMLLPKDIEDRTLYTILAKPVPRLEYLLGKLLGILLLLLISTLVMSVMFVIALYVRQQSVIAEALADNSGASASQLAEMIADIHRHTFTANLIPGVVIIYIKSALCAALTLFISTYASSWIFTIMISVAAYLIGHIQGIAREYWLHEGGGTLLAKTFLSLVALMFPDLQLFNLVDDIVAGNHVAAGMFLRTAGLGCLYLLFYTGLSAWVFSKKEL